MSDDHENAPDLKSITGGNREIKIHAARLGLALVEENITQKALAEKVSLSESTVSKWVNGTNAIPTNQYKKIARTLGRPDDFLIAPPLDPFSSSTHRIRKTLMSVADSLDPDQLEAWINNGISRLISNQVADMDDE